MKPIHLALVALVIVLGAALLLNMKPKEAAAPSPTSNTPTETPQNEINTQTQDNTMTPEEHAAMMGESPNGTDAGMEMPMADTAATQAGSEMKMFTINGTNFAFDVKEIRVKEGDTVMIHFMSADGFHDLVIDEFNVRTEKLKTGGMGMATFVASKKGTFEYYCSVGSHRANGMVGKLIVE